MPQVCSDALVLFVLAATVFTSRALITVHASPVGKAIAVHGDVRLARHGISRLLKANDELFAGDVLTAGEGDASLALAHGERFDMYPHSVTAPRNSGFGFDSLEHWLRTIKRGITWLLQDQRWSPHTDRQRWWLYSVERPRADGFRNPAHGT